MLLKHDVPYRTNLVEAQLPDYWYNVRADMPTPHDPFINPATMKPVNKEDMYHVFLKDSVDQEFDFTTRRISIPGPVMDFLRMYRPSPLLRAYNLEHELDTPAKIYYKFEGSNTSGSHKLNSAVAQVYAAKAQGIAHLTTETGAGQWGTALAMACGYFGVDLKVFMVKCSAMQKPHRRELIRTYGASVIASPSDTTAAGRKMLEENPDNSGSLGCAITEAVECALNEDNTRYALGSVLDHVMLHQAIIGSEAHTAMDILGEYPDIVIGCAGGGSNLGGIISEYMADRLTGKGKPYFIAVEPASCPSLTRGRYAYDFCDTGKVTPLARMYTLGSGFIPSPIHAGGLRYHGMSPVISKLYHDGYIDEARSVFQSEVFAAAKVFARVEGILPAPESSHAIKAAMDEAIKCREEGVKKTILFNLTGTGYFDMSAYKQANDGTLTDYAPTEAELEAGFASLNEIPLNR